MSIERQLWTSAPLDFTLAVHGLKCVVGQWPAPRLRLLFWPSGRVCWQVNLYLIALRKRGLATTTVNTYASELSRLLRFIELYELELEGLCDDHLVAFSQWLQSSGKKASANHSNRLILRTIEFLSWLQHRLPVPTLVGGDGDGAQITVSIRSGRRHRKSVRYCHPALVPPNVRRVVRPMTVAVLERLMNASMLSARSEFVTSRNLTMLKLLSDSGIRREELVWIRISDVAHALNNDGRLRIRTSKRSGNPIREVPVPIETLKSVNTFVEVHRRLQVRRLGKRALFQDEGWLFCTRTGNRMAAASVSQLFSDFRKLAGIEGRASAHMLRHRWITLQLVHRLRAVTSDQPFGVEVLTTLLTRLASVTGHSGIDSLWTYVDWAFDEHTAESAPLPACTEIQYIEQVCSMLDEAITASQNPGGATNLFARLVEVKNRLQKLLQPLKPRDSVAAHSFRSGSPQ